MPQCSHGIQWDDINLGQVMGIMIYYDSSGIYSLTFIYVDDNVFRVSSHGNNGRENCQTIILDYPTEFLTGVNGYRTISYVVKCITFVTNKATYGPFGNQSLGQYDRTFGCNQGGKDNRWITGFYGTLYDSSIASLGVILQIPTVIQPESSRPDTLKLEGKQAEIVN
ncbi:jacalin-related lectin 2-like [Ipomoea triloba]|uniref:jacalin-related lectin 2-like n=1 Tax=Ipomoea triloba TaxID=35885 RepID=UPI00125DDFA7|nr:jacalin-related lectin 2-like [Ipomoea triloba]